MKATRAQTQLARIFFKGSDVGRFDPKRKAHIVEKRAEAWPMRRLYVERRYHPVHDGRILRNVTYHESFWIGPRGRMQKVFRTTY